MGLKDNVDQLHILLRRLATEPVEIRRPIVALVHNLLIRNDYRSLLTFSQWYGETFLLPEVIKLLNIKPKRIVELGAGMGWLGKGLAEHFGVPYVPVDRRAFIPDVVLANLETDEGIDTLIETLEEGDFVVMADLLHCLESGRIPMLAEALYDHSVLILEYTTKGEAGEAFTHHAKTRGCDFDYVYHIPAFLRDKEVKEADLYPYHVWLGYVRT